MAKLGIEARQLSFSDLKLNDLTNRYNQILDILSDNVSKTAREIEETMCKKGFSAYFDLNHVRPRLTELTQAGMVIEDELKEDSLTHRKVTSYKLSKCDGRIINGE